MMTGIPQEIFEALKDYYFEKGDEIEIKSFTGVSGGSINHTGRLQTNNADIFIKWNDKAKYPGMLSAEAKGLLLLGRTNALYIPSVLTTGETTSYQYLLLEHIQSESKRPDFWNELAKGLVSIHKCSSSTHGLEYGNYIGSLQQSNRQCTSWVEFFIRQRLEPQIRMARNKGLIAQNHVSEFHKLYKKLEDLLPEEMPSLLHGDLWSGNLMSNYRGYPCLIDPAVYYGHREMDIAMTRLFGGFDRTFYSSYQEYYPMIGGWESRLDIYNLYPLLVHLNLFGTAYMMQIKSVLKKLV